MMVLNMKLNYPSSNESGIYILINKDNGKKWVGEADDFQVRAYNHQNKFSKNRNSRYLQQEYNDGHVFEFQIIEVMKNSSQLERQKREQYYMELWKTCDRNFGYNISKVKKHSKETRELQSKNRKGITSGTKNPRCKLSVDDVKSIYNRLSLGESYSDLASNFNVSKATIKNIELKVGWYKNALE